MSTLTNENRKHMGKGPLVDSRVQIYTELINLVKNDLVNLSTIEWEERIFFHTVMVHKIGLEKELGSLSFDQKTKQKPLIKSSNSSILKPASDPANS